MRNKTILQGLLFCLLFHPIGVIGQVGIGTTNPTTDLEVFDNSGASQVKINGNNGFTGIILENSGTETWYIGRNGTDDDDDLIFRRNASTNDMAISTTGFVGIGTTNPQEVLHIANNGATIRIDEFNAVKNPIKNNGIDLVPLAVDADGNMVLGDNVFLSDITTDISAAAGTFLSPTVFVDTVDGTGNCFCDAETYNSGLLSTINFSLTKETLIEINTSVAVSMYNKGGSSVITDSMNRLYGIAVYVNGSRLFNDADSHTSGDSGALAALTTYNVGYYNVGGNGFLILPAGNHTIDLYGYVAGVSVDTGIGYIYSGARAVFGDAFSFLKVVKHN